MNRQSFTVTNTSVDGRDIGPRPLGGTGIRPGGQVVQERAAQVAVRFEHARSCPEDPTMQLFLTDLSPSLGYGGNPGNDPAGLRHPALLAAARHVARACRCGHEYLQVLSFDLGGDFDIGPLTFKRADMATLTAAMESRNYGSGCSTLGPALAAATNILSDWDGPATVTVMSDFELTDPHSIRMLGELPAHVHAVVFTSPVHAELVAVSDDIEITHVAPTDTVETVAHAIHSQLIHHRPTGRRSRKAS